MDATGGKGANLVVNNVGARCSRRPCALSAYEGRHATHRLRRRRAARDLDIETLHTKRLTLFGVSKPPEDARAAAVTVRGFARGLLPSSLGEGSSLCRPRFSHSPSARREGLHGSNAQIGKIAVRIAG